MTPEAPRFKIDENLPTEAVELFTSAGFDCHSVFDENLNGQPDSSVASACRREGRLLVTLDLDFSDVRTYPPGSHAGIVVLRPRSQDRDRILALLRSVLPICSRAHALGELWIVEEERLRVRGRGEC